ncbi:hypothetical protein M407DRAFT_133853 [Tulasnella calospora MUT 4182]|uniref:Uncharacterized protein n=1 Tax=Tulasnella calospora MUT 4182 TaxID=1051891 RepID=A0A0C3PZA4_9AGAM|nr:hypothetical protein M407DRAFT_133853 [Tulasnella calospora MUT 4182]
MSAVNQQPVAMNAMSANGPVATQPTVAQMEQQQHNHACEKRGGFMGSVLRLRGGGAGKDCLLGAIGCFLCCECCEGCCDASLTSSAAPARFAASLPGRTYGVEGLWRI